VARGIVTHTHCKTPTKEELIMKRTQQSVLLAGLLALSLSQAACSYFPWKNTSGTPPSATPSTTQPVASSSTVGTASSSEKAAANGSASSSQN
jgi:hypothetical protein